MSQNTEPPDQIMTRLAGIEKLLSEQLEKKGIMARWSTIIIPFLSIIVALAGLLTGAFLQYSSTKTQIRMNQFEVTFNAKQQGYANLMAVIETSFRECSAKTRDEIKCDIDKITTSFYYIEPLISNEVSRIQLFTDLLEIENLLLRTTIALQIGTSEEAISSLLNEFRIKQEDFGGHLRSELFYNISP